MNNEIQLRAPAQEDVLAFGRLTGNDHGMHRSDAEAQRMGFPGIIVQGPYLLAQGIAAASEILRGKGKALLEVSWSFKGIAQPTQELLLTWDTSSVRRTSDGVHGIADIAVHMTDVDGSEVGSGQFRVLVTEAFVEEFESASEAELSP